MEYFEMLIKRIGERGGVNKLTSFLEEYDVIVLPLKDKSPIIETEERLDWKLPAEVKKHYLNDEKRN